MCCSYYLTYEYARLLPAAQILAFWFNNNLEEIRICCPASLNAPSSEQVSSPPDCNLYANSFWQEVPAVTLPNLAIQVPCWWPDYFSMQITKNTKSVLIKYFFFYKMNIICSKSMLDDNSVNHVYQWLTTTISISGQITAYSKTGRRKCFNLY